MSKTIVYDVPKNWENPIDTDGFEFLEFATPDPDALGKKFMALGFAPIAKHKSANIIIYQQNDIRFLINGEPNSKALEFAKIHGPSVSAMGFRVKDAKAALEKTVKAGARAYHTKAGNHELQLPAIYGVGDSVIYFVERHGDKTNYDHEFETIAAAEKPKVNPGLLYLDHVTHNLQRGNMDQWAEFYERVFNFKQIRYFDIEGKLTGLRSHAMTAPCGKIRIPLNESVDDKSQIEEFLRDYNGEGIQHIALGIRNIYDGIEMLKANGIEFLDTPDTYFDRVDKRLPNHGEDLARLRKNRILIDGNIEGGPKLLLQIFTKNTVGPVFFEIIQRKGDEGFGEGNFTALFESIEEDQIKRGVLSA
jgi:4-hydroxyphenylpyruvate dioxygenase